MVPTVVVLLGVSMLGALLFVMRARMGRGAIHGQALRAQEWVRKVDELGIELQMPALHEVVVGGTSTKADALEYCDISKLNKRTWNEFMVCKTVSKRTRRMADSLMTPGWGRYDRQPLSATRDTNIATPSGPMFQVVTLLRMPKPKLPRTLTHRRQPTDTTLTDSQPESDLGLAVYSSKYSIT